MGLSKTLALVWGLAEASFFFLVPDIWLSKLALENRAQAYRATGFALAGALLGGFVMYLWGQADLQQADQLLTAIPAINQVLINQVIQLLNQYGVLAIFVGPLMGIPYKIFAVHSFRGDISLVTFLFVSIPARGLRFLLIVALSHLIQQKWLTYWQHNTKLWLWAGCWTIFYGFYFYEFM